MSALGGMAAHAARRVERLKRDEPVESLRARPLYVRVPRAAAAALAPGAKVAELAFAAPERGLLVPREKATPEEAARFAAEAEKSGAVAVAVWVERNFHAGDYSHLEAAREACPRLILIARDVVVDPWQIERCRAAGADALELMPELLRETLPAVAAAVRALGLEPLVEDAGSWRVA